MDVKTTMKHYPFDIMNHVGGEPVNNSALLERPFAASDNSFEADARRFVPGNELNMAINTAIAVGEPLLITGEPGTGKTQAAYYAAYKLGIEPVLHFQVKSDSSAGDFLYHFDAVRYFYDASTKGREQSGEPRIGRTELNRADYIERRALWEALVADTPRVLLIDEIDKAPRDFPNDLLHELDKMQFTVAETQQVISAPKERRPIVFITSNSERRLPEPFLRRCVYHHIKFDEKLLRLAVEQRMDEYGDLSDGFIDLAVARFMALRDRRLYKRPSTGEFLVWLRILSYSVKASPGILEKYASQLRDANTAPPFLGSLLKNQQDIEDASGSGLK